MADAAINRRISAGLAEREPQKVLHSGNGGRNSPTLDRPISARKIADFGKTATISERRNSGIHAKVQTFPSSPLPKLKVTSKLIIHLTTDWPQSTTRNTTNRR